MKYSIDITITQIWNKNYVIHVLCEAQELSAQDLVGKVNEIFLLEWAWIGNIIFWFHWYTCTTVLHTLQLKISQPVIRPQPLLSFKSES